MTIENVTAMKKLEQKVSSEFRNAMLKIYGPHDGIWIKFNYVNYGYENPKFQDR